MTLPALIACLSLLQAGTNQPVPLFLGPIPVRKGIAGDRHAQVGPVRERQGPNQGRWDEEGHRGAFEVHLRAFPEVRHRQRAGRCLVLPGA